MSDNDLQLAWANDLVEAARAGRLTRRDVLRKATVFGLSLPLISAVLSACGSDGGSSVGAADTAAGTGTTTAASGAPSSGKRGGVLSVGALTPSTAVDPVAGFDGASIAVFQLVNEYLIWLNPDFTLRPQLAEKWAPEADGKRWTVTLREGVTFSDGTKLDAATVKASFDRLLDPSSKSAALSAFNTVLEQGGVSVKDPSTVVFDLARPYADFPYLISAGTYNAVILKPDYAGKYTDLSLIHI